MRILKLIILLITMFCFGEKSNGQEQKFDYGKIENNKYSNTYFNCRIKFPKNWIVQTQKVNDLAGIKSNSKDASEINNANLLTVFQYKINSGARHNPSISIIVENLKNSSEIKKGNDYLLILKNILKSSQNKPDYISDNFEKETIKGIDFYKMNIKTNYLGDEIKQIYFTTILKGFSFTIITSYTNDKQKKIILNSINSLKFKK